MERIIYMECNDIESLQNDLLIKQMELSSYKKITNDIETEIIGIKESIRKITESNEIVFLKKFGNK